MFLPSKRLVFRQSAKVNHPSHPERRTSSEVASSAHGVLDRITKSIQVVRKRYKEKMSDYIARLRGKVTLATVFYIHDEAQVDRRELSS